MMYYYRVEVGAELGEGGDLAVLRELELQGAGHLRAALLRNPAIFSPPPTSGFSPVEEHIEKRRRTKNSLAAGIGGWGQVFGCWLLV